MPSQNTSDRSSFVPTHAVDGDVAPLVVKLNRVIRESYPDGLTLDDFALVTQVCHSLGASYGRRLRELAADAAEPGR